MKFGFTGTRKGLTPEQASALADVVVGLTRGYHGACIGSDRQFHDMFPLIPMELYPSNEAQYQWALASCKGGKDVIHPIMEPLKRNHVIVDVTDYLIAAPRGFTEQYRGSGTWATIRYARKKTRSLIILWPNGRVDRE